MVSMHPPCPIVPPPPRRHSSLPSPPQSPPPRRRLGIVRPRLAPRRPMPCERHHPKVLSTPQLVRFVVWCRPIQPGANIMDTTDIGGGGASPSAIVARGTLHHAARIHSSCDLPSLRGGGTHGWSGWWPVVRMARCKRWKRRMKGVLDTKDGGKTRGRRDGKVRQTT